MTELQRKCEAKLKELNEMAIALTKSMALIAPAADTIETIIELLSPNANLFVFESQIVIDVKVKSMKEITPVLSVLERMLDIEFDRSDDSNTYWRSFSSKENNFIRVDASVSDDADAACRREVVGTEEKPVYMIVCDE